jgi:hypothetical protein
MSEQGFIALSRGLPNHPIVGFRGKFKLSEAWQWLLFNAAYRDRVFNVGSTPIALKRGQLAHSTRYMATAWGWKSESSVRRFLDRLKTGAMISADSGAGITVITICNYEFYQGAVNHSGAPNVAPNGAGAAQERRRKEQSNKVIDAPNGATSDFGEKALFERGRQVLGYDAGGLIAKLLKSKNRDIALARAAIETASTKSKPREYIGAVIAGGAPSGNGRRLTADEEFYGRAAIPGII